MRDLAELDVALDRPLPQNPDAERAVLGSILLNAAVLYRVPTLSAHDFFSEVNQLVFTAIANLEADRQPIDTLTIRDELKRMSRLDDVGGASYIASLTDMVPDIANCERYAAIVQEKAVLRALVIQGNKIMRAALESGAESQVIAAEALTALGKHATAEDDQSRPLVEVLHEACEAQERRRQGLQDDIALVTGAYPILDSYRALKRSFVLLGAPSEHGKTAALVNLGAALADHGYRGVLFTLESTPEELALRYASMRGSIPHSYMQDWRVMSAQNFERLAMVQKLAAKANLRLTRKVRTVEGIYRECQRLKATEGLDFALIDYVQIVRLGQRFENREERFAEIGQALLDMSLELGIMVLAASQVTDDWKKRDTGRLVKEDIKYARALAETARVVMLFHRPRCADKTNEAYPWCEVKWQVEKNNENRTADIVDRDGKSLMHFAEDLQQLREGTCEDNDCPRVRNQNAQRTLV